MHRYICEFLGTMLLMLLGNGLVAGARLERSGMKTDSTMQIAIGWGFAVMIPAWIFGKDSMAVFNPALTAALAAAGRLPGGWGCVPGYMLAQLLGAMAGQCLVFVLYRDHFDATEDPDVIFGCFATSPSIPNRLRNLLSEVIGTFVLVFAILGQEQVPDMPAGFGGVLTFGLISCIGMSFGGLTGYAINPARDLGPRLIHALLPLRHKGSSHWDYALIPIVGPFLGAATAAVIYLLVF